MDRRLVIVAVLAIAGALAAVSWWAVSRAPPPQNPPGRTHWLGFSNPNFEGESRQNTTQIWVAAVSQVSSEEPLPAYKAALRRGGTVLVEPVPVAPGVLGIAGDLWFEFFEYEACSVYPCPPGEGGLGVLTPGDYFRLSQVEVDATYTIHVYWAETGELIGSITVQTTTGPYG